MDIALYAPRDHTNNIGHAKREAQRFARMAVADMQQASDAYWNDYWGRSAVELEDKELERWWYHNQYWLACCLCKDKVAPGLFGNWNGRQMPGTSKRILT
jgi:alpha-L-fucosidase 2